jgi:RHS repeat-associated protein
VVIIIPLDSPSKIVRSRVTTIGMDTRAVSRGWSQFELREYDPVTGRFISVDPARQFSLLYIGMGNNPVKRVDPTGGVSPIYGMNKEGTLVLLGGRYLQSLVRVI